MQAISNTLYPNRTQLVLSEVGASSIGPLATASGVLFDPSKELEVYINGNVTKVFTFSYDAANDQYLIFTEVDTSSADIVQISYHMPLVPFLGTNGPLTGFALIATEASGLDPVTPVLGIGVPLANGSFIATTPVNQPPVFLLPLLKGWNVGGYGSGGWGSGGLVQGSMSFYAVGVNSVRIQSSTGSYDSGMLPAGTQFGSAPLPTITPGQVIDMTLSAYDAEGNPIILNGQNLELPFILQMVAKA